MIRPSAVRPESEDKGASASRPNETRREMDEGSEGLELTSESETDVIVEHGDLPDGSRILKLKSSLLFNSQHHTRRRFDSDLKGKGGSGEVSLG